MELCWTALQLRACYTPNWKSWNEGCRGLSGFCSGLLLSLCLEGVPPHRLIALGSCRKRLQNEFFLFKAHFKHGLFLSPTSCHFISWVSPTSWNSWIFHIATPKSKLKFCWDFCTLQKKTQPLSASISFGLSHSKTHAIERVWIWS